MPLGLLLLVLLSVVVVAVVVDVVSCGCCCFRCFVDVNSCQFLSVVVSCGCCCSCSMDIFVSWLLIAGCC